MSARRADIMKEGQGRGRIKEGWKLCLCGMAGAGAVLLAAAAIPGYAQEDWDVPPMVALTFDDGPHPEYTPLLLDGLRERGVTASFFILGRNVEGNEELLLRMKQEGHLIGNHTYNHTKLDDLTKQEAAEEIEKTSRAVEHVLGEGTEFIRPPFGVWDRELEYEVTMLPILWSVDTRDWTTKNVADTVRKAAGQAKDQDIILFHDCYESSVEAALQTVDLLLERGYEFVTADRIILAP